MNKDSVGSGVTSESKDLDASRNASKESRRKEGIDESSERYQSGYQPEIDKQKSQSYFKYDGFKMLPWWVKVVFIVLIAIFVVALLS